MRRRDILLTVGAVGFLSGCLENSEDSGPSTVSNSSDRDHGPQENSIRPEPRVLDVVPDEGPLDPLTGTPEVSILVTNDGGDGEIHVTLSLYDNNGGSLAQVEQSVSILRNETRRIDIGVEDYERVEKLSADVRT